MNSKFEFNKINEKINFYYEKLKYLTSPIIFKILYDKYNRPEIYEQIRANKLYELSKFHNKKLKNNFSSQNLVVNAEYFQEVLVYYFYEYQFKEKVFILNLTIFNLFQFFTMKLIKNICNDATLFVFLDNNRAIYNKIIKSNIGLTKIISFNIYICSLLTGYSLCRFLIKSINRPKREELYLRDKYKRSLLIYNKLF